MNTDVQALYDAKWKETQAALKRLEAALEQHAIQESEHPDAMRYVHDVLHCTAVLTTLSATLENE